MAAPSTSLGDLERAVMDVLWDADDALTVREVHDQLSSRGLAYTTVMTVLDRLAKKDVATRERDGRMWRYTAATSREQLTAAAMHESLNTVEAGDRAATMLHFLDAADDAALEDLRAALAQVERRHGST